LAELNDEHFAILRERMAEAIDIEFALASKETGRARPTPALREALMAVPAICSCRPSLPSTPMKTVRSR
jgi:hypothetical protein